MAKKWTKWTEEEKQAFYDLLSKHHLREAARIHAANTGKSLSGVLSWFQYNKEREIPQTVINSIPKKAYKPWTKEELKDLAKLIEENPNNFEEAFRIHARNTGRLVRTVQSTFHRYRDNLNTCMLTVGGKKKCSPNRKNIYPGTGGTVTKTKVSIWKKILNLLGL